MIKLKRGSLFFVSILVLGAVIAMVTFFGATGRVFLRSPETAQIAEPYQAYDTWRARGVTGRILVLFDKSPAADPIEYNSVEKPGKSNYVSYAVKDNIVRQVYHVVTDEAWEHVKANLSGRDDAYVTDNGVRLRHINGTALYIVRLRDLPKIGEKVLVLINGEYWDGNGSEGILELLKTGRITSDLVLIAGGAPAEFVRELQGYGKNN